MHCKQITLMFIDYVCTVKICLQLILLSQGNIFHDWWFGRIN